MNLLLFKVWISYDKRRWGASFLNLRFENDVKTYSIQTPNFGYLVEHEFENDVKTYSIQTKKQANIQALLFENDVKTYSIQTQRWYTDAVLPLRMM